MGSKLDLLTTIVMFALLLSVIPVIFNLTNTFFLIEFFVVCLLIIFGTMTIMEILSGKNMWFALFMFFLLNAVNIFAIYFRTFELVCLIIPLVIVIVGLYISGFMIKRENNSEVEPYYEGKHEVEVKEKPVKKTTKKKATKKKAKKKAKKKDTKKSKRGKK